MVVSESSSGPAFVIGGLRGFMHTWFLWPCQSVGLGAFPPDASGLLGVYTYLGRIFLYRLHVCNFHTVVPEGSFDGYVCHRRPVEPTATSGSC